MKDNVNLKPARLGWQNIHKVFLIVHRAGDCNA